MVRVLIVVDMQNDFIDGPLGSPEAKNILPDVCARLHQARAQGERIFLTLDTHGPDYLDTQEGQLLPAPHCIRDTPGWKLNAQVEEAAGPQAQLVEKGSFGSPKLARVLAALCQDKGLDEGKGMEIELCGVCTDICVVSNALLIKAALPEAHLSLNAQLCAGVTPEKHQAALEVLRSCQVAVS